MARTNITRSPMHPKSIAKTLIGFGKEPHDVAYRCNLVPERVSEYYGNIKPANDNAVLREVPFNGGCSTWSGTVPVSMPRVSIIDAVAA